MKNIRLWGKLLGINLLFSAAAFGGGYTVIPLFERALVEKWRLFQREELLNMAALAQSSPGAIAVNLAVLTGYRAGGAMGAAVSLVGAVLPPLLVFIGISACYQAFRANAWISAALRGMEAGAAALMADVVCTLSGETLRAKRALGLMILPAAFALSFFARVNAAWILLGAAAVSVISARRRAA